MTLALLLLLLASPPLATGNFIFQSVLPQKMVSMTVRVDFGPAQKLAVEEEITIREGSTPKEALRQILPITEGQICCHPAEVKGIDGVLADPAEKLWWRLKINGDSKRASPFRSRLKAGDLVEWNYFEEEKDLISRRDGKGSSR